LDKVKIPKKKKGFFNKDGIVFGLDRFGVTGIFYEALQIQGKFYEPLLK